MNEQQLKKQVEQLMAKHKVGSLATVQNGKPHSRYMTFHYEGGIFYTTSDKNTHKVEEIERNPAVHILIGYDGKGFNDPYMEIEGIIKLNDTREKKEHLWQDYMGHWLSGPSDPDYIVLEVHPNLIRIMNLEGEENPVEYKV
ncbi:pyridoxamine 5'-phosphate oxidase family protein [Pontibacillus litoralis]|uniref:General stress protein n=1 Tax=Pontibacillus litoralis JSM 072002 TaxID=1385512 RepID=A0A0A5FYT3_9BACI|nr:pyridoxamine 5'-phosphate oxidase family protein [Pontibacillus litoralis]KGX84959.1 general stress protein [Pontibacillus litoralis JSM 072002]